ncbi:hypothetical protein GCM10010992_04100 [Cloacibacterium rupense]|uniref:DUF4349 domain-containing protein n=1 Tax=Cloacibacterium rupense TaxID=517423 RepID=A0ABQ2NGH0_9FLAO|nr:DUF4349 domain-containing protein [Cloacibacterium rupense]GGP01894.1 hypothetical protein GCM10010992_04100 [Cloacibacterium rupense]
MKKLIFSIFTASIVLVACNKTDLQQASDSIKNADSLFNEAKQSYNTLDSISKVINDSSSTVGKVIIPEIEKHKEIIEDAVKKGNISIDSVQRQFDKIKAKTQQNEEIRKTIDSVSAVIKDSKTENVKVKDIIESANKILNKVKENPQPSAPKVSPNDVKISTQKTEIIPIVKTARLNISVEDIASAKAMLQQELRNTNGDLVTENYSENEGIAKEYITAKVPLYNFNNLVNNLANLGAVQTKTTQSTGQDYDANQMCDVEITLVDHSISSVTSTPSEDLNIINGDEKKDETFGDQSENAFMKGFSVLGSLFLALIPFWPIFLIGGIIWYFVAKRNKKKREEEFQRQLAIEREKIKAAEAAKSTAQETPQNAEQTTADVPKDDDDISKYMPKE